MWKRLKSLLDIEIWPSPPAPAPPAIDQWFFVSFDNASIRLEVREPKQKPWAASFQWENIDRVCFRANDRYQSDRIYIYTTRRPGGYLIPTQAAGGMDLWSEIIRRGLFDPLLASEASNHLFCWPAMAEMPEGSNFHSMLYTVRSTRDVVDIYAKAGWNYHIATFDRSVSCCFAEFELVTDSQGILLMSGGLADPINNLERVLSVLRENGIGYKGEIYDENGNLLKEFRSREK